MSWKPEYIILIILSTVVDYFVSIQLSKIKETRKRKSLLLVSLIINLGLLFTFKYLNFVIENLNLLMDQVSITYRLSPHPLLLPVGISFYTFQTLSYTIDVYKNKITPERNFGKFALFVSFFPQLVAGPIERSKNLLPQLQNLYGIQWNNVVSGLQLMLWGFIKKVMIADRLAVYVNNVYDSPEMYSGGALIVATIFFAVQIYCDFSGYSDIAIGTARIFGVKLMRNFNTPYFATSVSNFWARWHISLSTWFRDYVYIPLGGNRVVKWRWHYNLFITFLISGIWHGAAWTFVIWGAIHGGVLVAEKNIESLFPHAKKHKSFNVLGRISTLLVVLFAWIFFRADSIDKAFYIIGNCFSFSNKIGLLYVTNEYLVLTSFLAVIILFLTEYLHNAFNLKRVFLKFPVYIRWSTYIVVLISLFIFGIYGKQEFIYFQF